MTITPVLRFLRNVLETVLILKLRPFSLINLLLLFSSSSFSSSVLSSFFPFNLFLHPPTSSSSSSSHAVPQASRQDRRRAEDLCCQGIVRPRQEVHFRFRCQAPREGRLRGHQVRREPLQQSGQQPQDYRQRLGQMGSLRQRLPCVRTGHFHYKGFEIS